MADDLLARAQARLGGQPVTAQDLAARAAQRLGIQPQAAPEQPPSTPIGGPPQDGSQILHGGNQFTPMTEEDWAGLGETARTALTGTAPGAVKAREDIVNPNASEFTRTIEAGYRSWFPKFAQDPRAGAVPTEGITPSYDQIRAAAMRDPKVGRAYYDAWSTANALRQQAQDPNTVVNRTLAGKLPPRRPIPGQPPEFGGGVDFYSATSEEAKKTNADLLAAGTKEGLAKRAFARLSAQAAQPELESQIRHPWMAATAEIPGETARMVPALAAGAATGGLGAIPSALAFDAVAQGQRIQAGGQESWSPEQSAVNLLSVVGGGVAGRAYGNRLIAKGAEAATANRAAALLSNTVMTATPGAVEAGKQILGPDKLDVGGLLRNLYKGVAEAGALSSLPHLSPAHPDYREPDGVTPDFTPRERALAREKADAVATGDTAIHDALAAAEAVVKAQGERTPVSQEPREHPKDESNAVNALKSAQDAVLRAATPEPELRKNRQERRDILMEAMKPDAPREVVSTFDAMMALKADMKNEPPGSARRLYFGSEEYANKLADQFGVTDPHLRTRIREQGADLILEPHEKAETQGGFARIRTTPEERAQEQEFQADLTSEHQRANAALPEWLRLRANEHFDKLLRGVGLHPSEAPLISRTDPGVDAATARTAVEVGKFAMEKRAWDRSYEQLLRMAGKHRETMDTLFTTTAVSTNEEGANAAIAALPAAMREPFLKALSDYHATQTKLGHEKVALGRTPEARWAVPYRDEAGNPQIRKVATGPGEPPPESNIAGMAVWRIGGRAEYAGHYVHQEYPTSPSGKKRRVTEESKTALDAISGRTPSSAKERTKSAQEFLEQGNVSMEPSSRAMEKDFRDIARLKLLDYLATRTDLYRTKSEFEASAVVHEQQQKSIDIGEKITAAKKEINAHKKEMARQGHQIYAGETGELTKAMQRARGELSQRLVAQRQKMAQRLIPAEGMPQDFNPNFKENKRRATEIRREQAKLNLIARQLFTHARVEVPEEIFGVKHLFPEAEVKSNLRLRELHDQLMALEAVRSQKWKLLQSPDFRYGKHEGKAYVRQDALRDIEMVTGGNDMDPSLYRAWSSAFKFNRVAGNPIRSFFTQFAGNAMLASMGGVEMTPKGFMHWVTATEQAFKYLWSEGKNAPDDPLFHELIDVDRVRGPLALYDAPAIAKEQLFARLKEARELFEGTNASDPGKHLFKAMHRLGIAIADAMRYYPGQIPVFGKGTRLVAAMDLIPQYAMYRQLRTGDGSLIGKLTAEQALTHTGYFYDMSDVPRWVNKLAEIGAPTFARFAYKAPTAVLKWMMAAPPTFGTYVLPGLRLSPLFEHANRYVVENAGTKKATQAIWGIKAINLTLNAAKLYAHISAAGWLAAKAAGFDPGSEEYKRRKLAEAGGSTFRAALLFPLPKPFQPDNGDIKFFDIFNIMPGTNIFSLGQLPESGKGLDAKARAMQYVLSTNWITNALNHIANNTDYTGKPVPKDAPFWRDTLVNTAKNFLPGGLEMPVSALLSSFESWAQKSPLDSLAQALLGITIRVSKPGDTEALRMQELEEGGHIEYQQMPVPTDATGQMGLRLHEMNPAIKQRAFLRALERMRNR